MSDTPIYDENDGTNPIGEGTPTYAAGEDTPAPLDQDTPAPTQGEDPTPTPEGESEAEVTDQNEKLEGVATRDGQIIDPYPVTPEDMARVKARRHQATGQTTTDADVTQA